MSLGAFWNVSRAMTENTLTKYAWRRWRWRLAHLSASASRHQDHHSAGGLSVVADSITVAANVVMPLISL